MLFKTPLNSEHKKLGASMVEFGGWEMPVQYTNVIDEHTLCRKAAGLFDICHMGELMVEGKGAKAFLQQLLTNDVEKAEPGKAIYSTMCRLNGNVVDDLFVYMYDEEKYMIVVNASNIKKDCGWMLRNKPSDVILTDVSDKIAKIDLQGPKAKNILQNLTKYKLNLLKRFYFVESQVNGTDAIISRTGYTGEDGFELYFDASKAVDVWNKILEKGRPLGLVPCGLGARDTLRIEACYSLYGHELSEEINPLEAGLGWQVRNYKDFNGKIALNNEQKREIIVFEMMGRGVPRGGQRVEISGKDIGYVTSGTFSPSFKRGIGMALIAKDLIKRGDKIDIIIRNRKYDAKAVKRPLYSYMGGKNGKSG